MNWRRGLASLMACAAMSSAPAAPRVQEQVVLPGGARLALAKHELLLLDAQGAVLARQAVRGESLDARRSQGSGGVALLVDSNAERPVTYRFDVDRGTLEALHALPDTGRTMATACLYQDAQGLLHAIAIAENGFAQQWLLRSDAAPQSVREFAVAPEAQHCRSDDGRDRLYISEPGGVWRHRAEPEADDQREAMALVRPHGVLRQGGGELIVERDAVQVRDGQHLRRLTLKHRPAPALPMVPARVQTAAVAQAGDAADDPAIWVHPSDPTASLVLATDKKRGLAVYDLQGRELQFLPAGRLNNVDLRQDVRIGDERLDIALATQRDEHGLVLFVIGADRRVSERARLPVGYEDIYGLCMRRTPRGEAEVFVNDKDGRVQQMRIERDPGGAIVARRLREFRVASQPEGCVVDEAGQTLFLGEEKRGVWALPADPADARSAQRRLVLPLGALLHADVEGMAIYRAAGQAYLVVSSQGNDSYVVLDATAPYRVRGAFRIGINQDAGIDGASETDGLDITATPMGPMFPRGMLVVQDGRKRLPDGRQNFKYVSWDDVARSLGLP